MLFTKKEIYSYEQCLCYLNKTMIVECYNEGATIINGSRSQKAYHERYASSI